MAQLDRLLSVMMSQRATALRLDESELAELEIGGAPRPVTKTPLTGAQVLALLREIAPSESVTAIDAGQETAFSYVSDDGAFAVQTSRDGNRWRARVTVDEKGQRERIAGFKARITGEQEAQKARASGQTETITTPVRTPSASSDGDAISAFEGSERARASLDALLRSMVQRGSSDLHLRCGEPPIIRLHGEMLRVDQPVLEPEELEAMLRSIMPERNRQEY